MTSGLDLFPQAASANAQTVDHLYLVFVIGSAVIVAAIFLVILYLIIRFRRREGNLVARRVKESPYIEIAWSGIPLLILMGAFVWGAKIYFDEAVPPANSTEIYVVGKQWMWKLQHPQGNREINELHVPAGQPVKLVMTSEDVIHSFFIPAFRIKQDVLPGRYTQLWFQASTVGRFPLLCAEYCGTNHSRMHGWVYAMEPAEYQRWLSGGATGETMPDAGQKVFHRLACATCHARDGPPLQGLYRRRVPLSDGSVVLADEAYIRKSIIDPAAQIVRGYEPIMPTFAGTATEEEILQLIAYIRSLKNLPPGSLPEGESGSVQNPKDGATPERNQQ
ncbi:MAG: cytochrome c oxidase subunit II [Bryobacterales bacterium]|nr:cytochrome c oxidase subunit II [Bryobacterales bacterium]